MKKKTMIFIAIILILVITLFVSILLNNSQNMIVGSRKIATTKIDENSVQKPIKELKKHDKVKSTTYNVVTLLITYVIDVTEDTTIDEAKTYATEIISNLSDEIINNYDVQIHIKHSNNTSEFPISAYKHKTSEQLVWINI